MAESVKRKLRFSRAYANSRSTRGHMVPYRSPLVAGLTYVAACGVRVTWVDPKVRGRDCAFCKRAAKPPEPPEVTRA